MFKKRLLSLALTAVIITSSIIFIAPSGKVLADVSIDSTFPDMYVREWARDNVDTNGDGKLSTSEIDNVYVINLKKNKDGIGVADASGLEIFKNVQTIDLSNNSIRTLDVSSFTSLTNLNCSYNSIKSLKFSSSNSKLETINCSHNKLTELDVSNLTNLKNLNCSFNEDMTSLNAAKCPNLSYLQCSDCKLKQGMQSFNVSNSLNLWIVDISNNKFTSIDWGNKRTKMVSFDCSGNPIEGDSLKVNGLTALTHLRCNHTPITSLDVTNLKKLSTLHINYTKLTSLPDLTGNPDLEYLGANKTHIKSMDISNLKKLKFLEVTDSDMETIKFDNPNLYYLNVTGNKLTFLDTSLLPSLVDLICDSNELTDIKLGEHPNLSVFSCRYNDLTNIKPVASLTKLFCNGNNISEIDISGCPNFLGLVTSVSPEEKTDANGQVRYEYKEKLGVDANRLPYELTIDKGTKIKTSETSSSTNSKDPVTTITPSGESGQKILGFVSRLYTCVLGRSPEPDGAAYWSSELYNFRQTGAQVAQGFIFSQEFKDRNTSNTDFVTILYNTFFDRTPETDGLNYWVGQLDSGSMSRERVAMGFIYSQEWSDTCASYGIRSGGDIAPSGDIKPTDMTYGFVERLYNIALDRKYDEEGRQYWASRLANYTLTGEQIGIEFFLSDEMNSKDLSNEEFVDRLYQTFMDRSGDTDGINYWVGQLNGGASRQSVVLGFTRSAEFVERCIKARIMPY